MASYDYLSSELLDTLTYGNGAKVSYRYDGLGRQKLKMFDNDSTQVLQTTYNDRGQVGLIRDSIADTHTRYTYDLSGRVVGIQKLRGKATAPGAQLGSVEYVYEDGTARLWKTKTVTPFGSDTLTLTYGMPIYGKSPDRVYEVWKNGQKQKTYSYDALGRLISSSLPSSMGRTDSYTYQDIGSSGRTSTRVASYLCGGLYFTYTYDADGRIKTVSKNGTLTESYDYALDGSLVSATIGNDQYNYMYGANGNLLIASHNGQSVSYNYDDLFWGDLLTNYNGTSISYDTIGNPLNWRDGMAMTWQHGRELSSVTKGGKTFAYSYGADGVRTQKTVDGVTTEYYTVGGKLLAEKTGDQVLTFHYDEKGSPYALELNGTRYYYRYSLQGDVIGLYSTTGAVVAEYTYDPWGKLLSVTDTSGTNIGTLNPLRYRGYYYDTETGFYFLQSRYYDPTVGRFINADDFEVLGVNQENTKQYNLFAYCLNDPVNRCDDNGDLSLPNWAKIAIGAAAIAVGVAATALTGGAALPVLFASLKIAATSAAIGAISGAGISAISHRVSTGSWKGSGEAAVAGAIDGACDGFMWGGITAGATFTTVAARGVKIQEIGRLKPSNKSGKGHPGVKYNAPKANGKYTTRSIELHSPHRGGPHNVWHWQQNTWNPYNNGITGSAKHWTIWWKPL